MRLLHTSDWHLGNRLMEQSRQGEFAAFFDWLLTTMREQKVEALLISGDIFDSTTPSDSARELYCDFLSRADATGCRHIIITGGNHDSVQQLRVAAPLLERHHARVIPTLRTEHAADCLIPLYDAEGREAALVAAVPFLRVAEVSRRVNANDSEARRRAYADGIADCYTAVAQAAQRWKAAASTRAALPIIAMGHLSVSGARHTDSTRPVTIGHVEAVSSGIFDPVFDYVALGHLHQASAHGSGRIRYCGSPLPMGFDEAAQGQQVLLADICPGHCELTPLPVPRFALYKESSCASQAEVDKLLTTLKEEAGNHTPPLPVWLKLTYTGGDQSLKELNVTLSARAEECHLRAFRAMRAEGSPGAATPEAEGTQPTLQEMEPDQLFTRRLTEWQETLDTPPPAQDIALLHALFREAAAEAQQEPRP